MATKTTNYGLNLGEVLLVVFIVLKLTNVIDWSWWWVLSPVWIGLITITVILGSIVIKVWKRRNH